MLSTKMQQVIRTAYANVACDGIAPKRGDEIFTDPDEPRTWDEFVGQRGAILQLKAAIGRTKAKGVRMPHLLLASGGSGVGKTTLARITAHELGTGLVEMSGKVTVDEARTALRGMEDGDVLFLDELHTLVAGGKKNAEWLLHLMQSDGLMTSRGFEPMPKVTSIGATTDAGLLPTTILNRFMIRPVLEAYTDAESTQIAGNLAARMKIRVSDDVASMVARAAMGSPRDMKAILTALDNTRFITGEEAAPDFDLALEWVGVTRDGLTRLAQDYLIVLLTTCQGKGGLATIAGALGEPGPLGHAERALLQNGYITIQPGGRQLTEEGLERTKLLLKERDFLD